MTLARSFFNPLGAEVRSAIADLTDGDLAAAHRVFNAMIAAMSTFETQLTAQSSKPSAADGKRATPAKARRAR